MQVENGSPNTPAPNPLSKLSFSIVLSGLTAYSVAVGMAYLWGYWSPFGINILDYMGMSDILTATAWPLISIFAAMLVGMLMGGRSDANKEARKSDRVGRALIWYWTNLRELHFFGLFLIWILEVPNKWFLLGLFGGVPLTVYMLQKNWMDQIPGSRQLKLMVVFFVVCAPAAAISSGQHNSKNLLDGRVFQVVFSDVVGMSYPPDVKAEARLRLIGLRGETLFMWDPQQKRTVVAKFPTDRPLVLGRVDTVSTGTGWAAIALWAKNILN